MNKVTAALALLVASIPCSAANAVVFWEPGFPTIASQPVSREAIGRALEGMDPAYISLAELKTDGALTQAELLVLPYGSSVPEDAWHQCPFIDTYPPM